jgi:hypothetical protein
LSDLTRGRPDEFGLPDLGISDLRVSDLRLSDRTDRQLLNLAHKATQIIEAFPDRLPNTREMEEMTRVFGVDLVNVALIKILAAISPNRFFLERVDHAIRELRYSGNRSSKLDLRGSLGADAPEFCVIESQDPFATRSRWGGHVNEWRDWARSCGLTTEVLRTEQRLHPLENASLIREQLAKNPHEHRIIASVGQGSAEFRLLVEQLLKSAPHELHGIRLWINVCGLIRGASSPTIANAVDRRFNSCSYRLQGWPLAVGDYLGRLNPRLRLEPDFCKLQMVNVSIVGIPSLENAPFGLKSSFDHLSARGPNDGVVMFHDSIVRPGYILPIAGMSHRAEPEKLGLWLKAVLRAHLEDFTLDTRNRQRLQLDL